MKAELHKLAVETVRKIRRRLPPELRSASENVIVLYQEQPDPTVLLQGFDSDLLGLFEGPSRIEEDPAASTSPPRIVLYLKNLWDLAGEDPLIFAEEIRTTYLHELGHFLGFEEDDLRLRDLD